MKRRIVSLCPLSVLGLTFHGFFFLFSFLNVLSLFGLRGFSFELVRNLTAALFLIHLIQIVALLFVLKDIVNVRKSPRGTTNTARKKLQKRSAFSGRSGTESIDCPKASPTSKPNIFIGGQYTFRSARWTTFVLLVILFSLEFYYGTYLFRAEKYFKLDRHRLETLNYQFVDLGEDLPEVSKSRVMSEKYGRVKVFLLQTLSCWSFKGDLGNTLLLRRLATRLRHSRRPYIVVAHMSPQPASRRYNRLARLRPGIVTASDDGPIVRAIKVLTLQPRLLIFASRPGLLSDPKVRAALQSSGH